MTSLVSKRSSVFLVAGASGIIGRAFVRVVGDHTDAKVFAASRRPELDLPENAVPFHIDLNKWKDSNTDQLADVTHLVYSGYVDAINWEKQRKPNNDLFKNCIELVYNKCRKLQHVALMQGTKAYGAHLGPFKTPAKETDPRISQGYFYDDQFDILSAVAEKTGWNWRPY